jgi:hypothetical protein
MKARSHKKCTKCKQQKTINDFHTNSTKYDGYASECKSCVLKKVQDYCYHNRERNQTQQATPAKQICCECKLEKDASEFQRRIASANGLFYKCKACWKKWYHNNPQFKLSMTCRGRIRLALKRHLQQKTSASSELIGCTWEHLQQHLEKQFVEGMNWSNYGQGWVIDHKRPCAEFDLTIDRQQKECFHFSNLQPLWALDNMRKNAMPYEAWLMTLDPDSPYLTQAV